MRFSHAHTLPTLYVPPSEHPVAASTDQQLSAWAPIQGQHAAGILGKGAQALPPVHIPQEHLPTASAPATTGEPAIIAAAGQARAVRTPGHATDQGRVRTTYPPLGARHHVPHLHPIQIAPTGKPAPIWTPSHGMEGVVGVVGVLEDLETGPGGWVPQPNGMVPPATGKILPIWTPSHSLHGQAMSVRYPGRRAVGHLPDGHQPIRACTGEPFAIRTPGHVVEADRMMRTHCSLATSHTRRVPSSLPLSRRWLSGVKAMLYTGAVCPRSPAR